MDVRAVPLVARLVFSFRDCALKERLSARLCVDYGRWLGGFRTLEKRAGAIREGFEIEALGGGREILASKKLLSASVLNKYGLNLRALENTALGALETAAASGKILLFDELGPMAMRSEKFSARAVELIFSGKPCLVFYRKGAAVFEEAFSKMADTVMIELSQENWAGAVAAARAWLDARIGGMEPNK